MLLASSSRARSKRPSMACSPARGCSTWAAAGQIAAHLLADGLASADAFGDGRGSEEERDATQPRISIRSCSAPARWACVAACSHASDAASACASIQCSHARSRSASQSPASSSVSLEDRHDRVDDGHRLGGTADSPRRSRRNCCWTRTRAAAQSSPAAAAARLASASTWSASASLPASISAAPRSGSSLARRAWSSGRERRRARAG